MDETALEVLHSTSEVIDALGGNRPVAVLTQRTREQSVSNWRGWDYFPPDTYVVLKDALRAIGKTAPDSMWRMVASPETQQQPEPEHA